MQDGKLRLDLDCSYDAARVLLGFLSSKDECQQLANGTAPSTLKELASLATEWKVQRLLQLLDQALAEQMQKDVDRSNSSDEMTWQYSGSHIRERAVQMLQLAQQVSFH